MWFTSRQNQGQVIFWTYCEGFWRHVRNCFMSVHSWNSFSVLFHWNGFCILASQCSSAKNIETVVMDSLIMNNLRFYWVSPPILTFQVYLLDVVLDFTSTPVIFSPLFPSRLHHYWKNFCCRITYWVIEQLKFLYVKLRGFSCCRNLGQIWWRRIMLHSLHLFFLLDNLFFNFYWETISMFFKYC